MAKEPHDHSHEHDHPHDHDHDHDHGPETGAPSTSSPAPVVAEDSSTQALSDALRSSFWIVKLIMVVLVVLFFASGVFTVPPQSRAVVFRFGQPVGEGDRQLLGPGLHWSFPSPIDEVVFIPIGEFQTVKSTVGWYATTPELEAAGQLPQGDISLNPATESYTVTGDGNIIHVKATLRYRINDPLVYAFQFADASNIVQNALNNALVYASSRFNVDGALRTNQAGFKEIILGRVSQLVTEQKLGITLEPADVVAVAPLYLRRAFDAVLASIQEQSKTVEKARGYSNALVSKAEGEATAITNRAVADSVRGLQLAKSDAEYLQDRLPEYRKNPDLFKQRYLAETMAMVLTNNSEKFVTVAPGGGAAPELRLLLSREPEKPLTETNQTARP
jgi:membrane protease subunit HflK